MTGMTSAPQNNASSGVPHGEKTPEAAPGPQKRRHLRFVPAPFRISRDKGLLRWISENAEGLDGVIYLGPDQCVEVANIRAIPTIEALLPWDYDIAGGVACELCSFAPRFRSQADDFEASVVQCRKKFTALYHGGADVNEVRGRGFPQLLISLRSRFGGRAGLQVQCFCRCRRRCFLRHHLW